MDSSGNVRGSEQYEYLRERIASLEVALKKITEDRDYFKRQIEALTRQLNQGMADSMAASRTQSRQG